MLSTLKRLFILELSLDIQVSYWTKVTRAPSASDTYISKVTGSEIYHDWIQTFTDFSKTHLPQLRKRTK